MRSKPSDNVNQWLAGGGEAGALVRATDWSATPLGPVEDWPQSLRTAASICLRSRFPMLVMWGPELVMLYNDGYRPTLGQSKHPGAMGQRVRDCWREAWPTIGPLLQGVVDTGEPTWAEDQRIFVERSGYVEECYFTFSYSPLHDENDGLAGVLATVVETTERVVGERRLRILHEFAGSAIGVSSLTDVSEWFTTALAASPADLPFALLYLVEDGKAVLASHAGGIATSLLAGRLDDIGHGTPDLPLPDLPLAQVLASGAPVLVEDLAARFGARPEPGGEPHEIASALVMPVAVPEQARGNAVLVAGISPNRRLDDEYRQFLGLVAHHVGAALAAAQAHEDERQMVALAERAVALQESESRFRRVMDDTPALIWTAEPSGRCDYFNAAWLEFTGRTREQETGYGWTAGVHPDDRAECLGRYGAAVDGREPFSLECRLRHATGEYRWILAVGAPRFATDGAFLGHVGSCLDITDRRQAETALRMSEEIFRSLSACTPVGIFTSDHQGLITYSNPMLQAITGLTPAEALGDGSHVIDHPDDCQRAAVAWRNAVESGQPMDIVMRIQNRERGVRWVRVRTAPLELDGGEVTGHVGTVEDITEQRQVEEALRRAEFQYRELVEMSQAVVWRGVGEIPRVTFVNRRAAELSGIAVERWMSEPMLWLEQMLPEDREPMLRALQRARSGPQEAEIRIRDVDGKVICLRNFVRYLGETTAGPEFIGMMFDETELRHAREKAETSRTRLRELAERLQTIREQEQARIAREIHDELGQSLTGLKLKLAWLAGRLPGGSAELTRQLAEMLALIDDTIETVRRIATRLRPGVLDDLGLFAALEWLARDFEKRTGVLCRLTLPAASCRIVEEHVTPIFRVAQEALTNVARHAGATRVAVTLSRDGDQCILTVADDGCGMEAEMQGTRHSLGLLGMRERAIASGGAMTVSSRPGEGTTVTARFGGRRDDQQGSDT